MNERIPVAMIVLLIVFGFSLFGMGWTMRGRLNAPAEELKTLNTSGEPTFFKLEHAITTTEPLTFNKLRIQQGSNAWLWIDRDNVITFVDDLDPDNTKLRWRNVEMPLSAFFGVVRAPKK